ncbi:MAG: hypothetical protein M3179_07935 [Actinomycetota bacterium]|nr:hypothetical protein [Actinomycetota bacterium]
MVRRVLVCLLTLALAAGLAACGDDDDETTGATSTVPGADEETQETANFCQELVEFATQVMSGFNAGSQAAIAEWTEEVATQARELAASAPPEIRDTVEGYASSAEDVAEEVAAGRAQEVGEITNKINESFTELSTYAQENCQGVSVPTTAPGGPGG